MLKARMTDSVSTPGWPRGPRISVMTPSPSRYGRRVADHLEGDLVARLGPLGPGVADVDRVVERRAVDLDVARRRRSSK